MLPSTILGVVLLNVVTFALVVARSRVFRTPLSRRLLLHLALSFALPVVVYGGLIASSVASFVVPGLVSGMQSGVVLAFAGLVWLLLLPGGGFLLTDLGLGHRREGDGVPMPFDVLLALCLAVASVLNIVLSVAEIRLFPVVSSAGYAVPSSGMDSAVVVAPLLLLVSFATYLGIAWRRNGWDMWRPRTLARQARDHLRAPGGAAAALGFTIAHVAILGIVYVVMVPPVYPMFVGV